MDRELWRIIARHLSCLTRITRDGDFQHPTARILRVYLWAVLHDRPVYWACDRRNWVGIKPPRALPDPVPGEPSGYRPACATPGPGWVSTVDAEAASGPEADLYPEGQFIPNVQRAMSLVPDEVRGFFDVMRCHYLPVGAVGDPAAGGRAISRPQMELLAARVSALNQCLY